MRNILFASLAILFLNSCVNQLITKQKTQQALNSSLKAQENSLKLLEAVGQKANDSEKEGKITSSINNDLQKYVEKEKEAVEKSYEQLTEINTELQSTGLEKNKELELISKANEIIIKSNEQLRILDEKTKVIVDFLNNETYSKSEMGAMFAPGEYVMVPEQIAQGEKLFLPTIEKLYDFAKKYENVFNSFDGEIIITGYSDATSIEKGSKLYKELSIFARKDNPNAVITNEILNRKLSELRAIAVKELLKQIIDKRKYLYNRNVRIKLTVLGKGEEIPKGLNSEISINDFRRRVVTFYWVVLPKLD